MDQISRIRCSNCESYIKIIKERIAPEEFAKGAKFYRDKLGILLPVCGVCNSDLEIRSKYESEQKIYITEKNSYIPVSKKIEKETPAPKQVSKRKPRLIALALIVFVVFGIGLQNHYEKENEKRLQIARQILLEQSSPSSVSAIGLEQTQGC